MEETGGLKKVQSAVNCNYIFECKCFKVSLLLTFIKYMLLFGACMD